MARGYFAKEMDAIYPEIHNWKPFNDDIRSRRYLRKSAFICGSFLSFRIRVYSRPFAVSVKL